MKPRKGEFGDLIGVGGAACLDFANTVSGRGTATEFDRLEAYADLAGWACDVGLLTERDAGSLAAAAGCDPDKAQDCFERALDFRQAIYRCGLGALGGVPAGDDLAALAVELFPLLSASKFAAEGDGAVRLRPLDGPPRLDRPLWDVAWSAFRLFTGEERGRLKQCENEGCTWLFLDRSKNGSRRWCSMQQCGDIVKAREYRARRKRG